MKIDKEIKEALIFTVIMIAISFTVIILTGKGVI